MSESILLNVDTLHRLMRIFIEHKADILPVVERGRIIGQLDRLAIMEALSEIRPEGCHLQLKTADSTEDLLRRLDNSETGGLPTINRAFEFNALWGRAEILQAQGKIPQVKIWQPQAASAQSTEPTSAETAQPTFNIGKDVAPPQFAALTNHVTPAPRQPGGEGALSPAPWQQGATITIVREPSPPQGKPAPGPPEKKAAGAESTASRAPAEKLHRELERGRLAINTLAALELPLMACDGSGAELFHNRAFGKLRRKFAASLDSAELVRKAKDAIAESALKGDLDIDSLVKVRVPIQGYTIFCKAIRDFDNLSARAQGYIFWLETAQPAKTLTADLSSQQGDDFSGRSLPEILAAEERRAIAWAMREANGNQSDAAMLLGIPRQTFNYRYRKLTRQEAENARKKPKEQTDRS